MSPPQDPRGPYAGRRSGRPWLAWLIILIIIGFIIWLIVAYAAAGAGNRGAQPGPGGAGPVPAPITDLAAIVGATNRHALAGRTVSLTDVTVADVAGDQGFWVGNDGRELFVRSPNLQRVNRGETINVGGTLEHVPKDPQQAWNIDPTTARMVSEEGVYLLAGSIGAGSSS